MKLTHSLLSVLLLMAILVAETRPLFLFDRSHDHSSISQHDDMEKNEMEESEKEGKEKSEDSNETVEKLCPDLRDAPNINLFSVSPGSFVESPQLHYSPHFEVISPPPQLV